MSFLCLCYRSTPISLVSRVSLIAVLDTHILGVLSSGEEVELVTGVALARDVSYPLSPGTQGSGCKVRRWVGVVCVRPARHIRGVVRRRKTSGGRGLTNGGAQRVRDQRKKRKILSEMTVCTVVQIDEQQYLGERKFCKTINNSRQSELLGCNWTRKGDE